MNFHLVKLNYKGTYLHLVDPKSKPRFVCFAEKKTAGKYIDYAAEFRAKNRIWPCLDMTSERRRLDAKPVKYGRPEQIKRYLEIETLDLKTLDRLALRTNVSFYCILRFETEDFGGMESISMAGQEMDGDADPDKYIEWMNINLKIS